MSLSTFGGEINPHRNFDLDVCANCGMECVRIQEQVARGERKRMVGLAYLGGYTETTHGTSCWGCEARFSRNSR